MLDMFKLAGKIAISTNESDDPRNFMIGCVGIRRDGVKVVGRNAAVFSTLVENYQYLPASHAEGRVMRKLGKGGTVYVARVARRANEFAMSRPCPMCQVQLRSLETERVYYTINPEQYGIWYPREDRDKVFEL